MFDSADELNSAGKQGLQQHLVPLLRHTKFGSKLRQKNMCICRIILFYVQSQQTTTHYDRKIEAKANTKRKNNGYVTGFSLLSD